MSLKTVAKSLAFGLAAIFIAENVKPIGDFVYSRKDTAAA